MKFVIVLVLAFFAACGVDDTRHAHRLADAPDAGVMPVDAAHCPLDAGVNDCCRFYPNTAAVAACVNLPANTCGVIECRLEDCSLAEINACGPTIDAGVGDAP